MSGKEHTQSVALDSAQEAAASQYLRQHPDFFQRHSELLNHLTIPDTESGAAISLIERQVDVLRDDKRSLEQRLHELVDVARQNEILSQRLQQVALMIARATDVNTLLDRLPEVLRREFTLVCASVRIGRNDSLQRSELVDRNDANYIGLLERTAHGRSVCDDRLPESLLSYLFGDSAKAIRSTALIPLMGEKPMGVLGLGASDPDRFCPEMGTVYLDRLGELVEAGLSRLHR